MTKQELSEVNTLRKFTVAELVGGGLLLAAIVGSTFQTNARVSVIESQLQEKQTQLDRMERDIRFLVERELNRNANPK